MERHQPFKPSLKASQNRIQSVTKQRLRHAALLLAMVAAVLALFSFFVRQSHAYSTGIVNASGNPETASYPGFNCNACHLNGSTPTVTLSGPLTVTAGFTYQYSLTVQSGQVQLGGPAPAAGLNVSASDGTLVATGPDVYTAMNSTGEAEITHVAPKPVQPDGSVIFSFAWQAPSKTGQATMYAAGNSVEGGGSPNNDLAAFTTQTIAVEKADFQLNLPIIFSSLGSR